MVKSFSRQPANSCVLGHTEETRKLMSLAHQGIKHTPESCEKISRNKKGWKPTEETLKNMSASHKGCIPWNKGVPMTEEAKLHLSKINTGKSPGNKNKKVYNDGIRHFYLYSDDPKTQTLQPGRLAQTEKHRKRISISLKGKPKSEEYKEKKRLFRHSEETKAKMRELKRLR